jgi:hypothetical protein
MKANRYTEEEVEIHLTRDEFDLLLLCMGIALGATIGSGVWLRKNSVLRLVNRINEGNPQYIPYEISEEEAPQA